MAVVRPRQAQPERPNHSGRSLVQVLLVVVPNRKLPVLVVEAVQIVVAEVAVPLAAVEVAAALEWTCPMN